MSNNVRVVQTKRRTWDAEEYKRRAEQQNRGESDAPKRPTEARPSAKARDTTINLDSQVGKTQVINSKTGGVGGFYCDLCQCGLRDSIAYLDHINGVKHQKNLGLSVRAERVGIDEVRAKLDGYKRKHDEITEYDFDTRVRQLEEQDAEDKKKKREEKKAKHKEVEVEKKQQPKKDKKSEPVEEPFVPQEETEEDKMMAMLGLANGFGSSKKN